MRPRTTSLLLSGALLLGVGPAVDTAAAGKKRQPIEARSAEDLMVVDCLLPGQVRRLGRRMTFVTARRPTRTTAVDCEIRGGEYTAFDRASYATALEVWLPAAEAGDAEAQAFVGEIFEKGIGGIPDYEAAAVWYRRAADQGLARAQINLGHLYEKGLGVEPDPQRALAWYRRAAGLPGAIRLEPPGAGAPADRGESEELEALRRESARLRRQVEELQTRLDESESRSREQQRELERLRSDLEERERQLRESEARDEPPDPEVVAEIERLKVDLAAQSQSLEAERRESSRLRNELAEAATVRRDLDRQQRVTAELRAELESYREREAEANRRLAEAQEEAEALEVKLEEMRQELAATGTTEARVKELESQLAQSQAELDRRQQRMARLKEEAESYRERLAEIEREPGPAAAEAALEEPTIELIEPRLLPQRGAHEVTFRGGVSERTIVGRVTAPAGLMSFFMNDQKVPVEESGLFEVDVPLDGTRKRVTFVAIDRRGRRNQLQFALVPEAPAAVTARAVEPEPVPDIDFGNFHALLIGNNDYTKLPKLRTAINDIRTLAELLETRFGFQTTTLLDASRYEILSALNELRGSLDEDSNLLIYYAGHGELDRVIQRGYWLPVDAEPESTANWISTSTITDHLSVIPARHILVVADSCYSGALTRSSLARLQQGMTADARKVWIEQMVTKRSRTALTSGGLKPVLDTGGGENSVFAKALLSVLAETDRALPTQELYREVSARVTYAADALRVSQIPEYAPIRFAGHESGDFFFVPRG